MLTASFTTPAARIAVVSLPTYMGTVSVERSGFSAVAFACRHEYDFAV